MNTLPIPFQPTPPPAASRPVPPPHLPRAFTCRCGRPIFFRNSQCLGCGTPLGYAPEARKLLPLVQVPNAVALWQEAFDTTGAAPQADAPASTRYRRCERLLSASACNWLIEPPFDDRVTQCRSCRLDRTLPDLSMADNALWFTRIQTAKRRLVSQLISLGLPVRSKLSEDPSAGLAFDLLRSLPGAPAVVTGHVGGIITLDIEEADDATREQRRSALHEPYRTLLGHLRHESGHYYWERLVAGSGWQAPFRALFGDERDDYLGALQRHYNAAPDDAWRNMHVSSYAACHPWEDWAETWAHYLHLRDTLDTARSFGLDGSRVELNYERFDPQSLGDDDITRGFAALLEGWIELTGVLNELSRSMGAPDFYPFVLSLGAVRKLAFVHRVVEASA